MIKKSLHLKAQYAKVKSDMAALTEIDTRTNHSKSTATAEVEALGSGLAPWLVLSSGQSTYLEEVVSLKGVMPINLQELFLYQPWGQTL